MSPRVLVTRAREDSLPFADGLVAAGAEPVFVPLVAREWVSESTAPLRRALVTAEVVLLTSAASAEAVADEAFREKKGWEKEIREHIAWSDRKLRKLVGIGFEVVAIEPWTTHQSTAMTLLLNELEAGLKQTIAYFDELLTEIGPLPG